MDLISIIVPVYMVVQYINRCLESIINQSYENLEIFIIDDGSPDCCSKVCDEWAVSDSRIIVIHKQNGGLSEARNIGMRLASGQYIGFVDSDDWIAHEMYACLLSKLQETDSDIVSCNALRIWEDGQPPRLLQPEYEEKLLIGQDVLRAIIQSTYLVMTVWNKLYKADLVRDIEFEVGKIHEDEFWSWQVIAKAKKVLAIREVFYYYTQRSESIMNSEPIENSLLVLEAREQRHQYIKENNPELEAIDDINILYTCYHLGSKIIEKEKSANQGKYLNRVRLMAKKCKIEINSLENSSIFGKFHLLCIKANLPLTCRIEKFLKDMGRFR